MPLTRCSGDSRTDAYEGRDRPEVAQLAALLARAYLRVQAGQTSPDGPNLAPQAPSSPGLDSFARESEGCRSVNRERTL